MYEANPLSFEIGGNGYPEQTRTLLDRFKIRACYRLKFDQGIISDAGAFAAHDQTFIAEMFGMDKMRHMMLNEDRDTLPKQPGILGDYIDTAGFDTRASKSSSETDEYYDMHMHGRDIHDQTVMIPCSDSTKIAGQAAEYENICIVREHIRNLSTRTLKNKSGEAIEIKWGCGMSDGRFGGDYETVRAVIVQEMKAIAIERGSPYDYNNKQDRRF